MVGESLGADGEEAVFVVLFEHRDVIGPGLVSLADEVLGVARQTLQAQVLALELRLVYLCVEELAGHGVYASGLQLVDRLVHRLLEHAHQVGVDAHGLEEVHLGFGLGETVQDPTVDTTITLADSLINQAKDDLIWNWLASLRGLLQLHFDGRVLFCLSSEDLLSTHVDKSESVSDHLGLGGAARTWGSDEHDLGRATRGVVAVANSEHTGQVVSNLVLWLLRAVNGVDELVEGILDSCHVDLVLLVHPLGDLISVITVDILVLRHQVLLDLGQGGMLPNLQVDELVGNDAHLLERKGLDTRPRESLNDPALSLLLETGDLSFHKFDHDLVVDYTI